jgi:hypothetical protein
MADMTTLSPEEIKTLKDFLNLGRSLTSSLTSSQIASFASGMGRCRNSEISEIIDRSFSGGSAG